MPTIRFLLFAIVTKSHSIQINQFDWIRRNIPRHLKWMNSVALWVSEKESREVKKNSIFIMCVFINVIGKGKRNMVNKTYNSTREKRSHWGWMCKKIGIEFSFFFLSIQKNWKGDSLYGMWKNHIWCYFLNTHNDLDRFFLKYNREREREEKAQWNSPTPEASQ